MKTETRTVLHIYWAYKSQAQYQAQGLTSSSRVINAMEGRQVGRQVRRKDSGREEEREEGRREREGVSNRE